MSKIKLFISSVQSEFEAERKALANFLRADALLSKFFDPFLFEELPAIDKSVQQVYLNEVESSQIYLGIIGKKYGCRDSEGVYHCLIRYLEENMHIQSGPFDAHKQT